MQNQEVLIDPGSDPTVLYEDIDLPCNKELRINNSIDAPLRQINETPNSEEGNKN